jgi:glucose-6-phosphate dehydrogenase assembly protein OpcA
MSLDSVERELARLRMNDDGTVGLRASVLNLVVVVGEESAERVAREITEISNRHPSRSIILVPEPEGEEKVDVRLSAFCSVRGGSRETVCSEQITVLAGGRPALHLESVAGPLLVPDLPTFVFYPEGVPESADGVTRLAKRVILDSAASPGPPETFRRMADLAREPGISVGDLQWTALSAWRALARELFASPERAGDLRNVREVEVLHTSGGESRTVLFAGWLASSLGWSAVEKRSSPQGFEVFFDSPGGRVVFKTSPSPSDADLSRITFRAGGSSFVVSRHKELTEARIRVERGEETLFSRAVRIGRFDMEAALGEELKYKGRDPVFESSLEKVMEITSL